MNSRHNPVKNVAYMCRSNVKVKFQCLCEAIADRLMKAICASDHLLAPNHLLDIIQPSGPSQTIPSSGAQPSPSRMKCLPCRRSGAEEARSRGASRFDLARGAAGTGLSGTLMMALQFLLQYTPAATKAYVSALSSDRDGGQRPSFVESSARGHRTLGSPFPGARQLLSNVPRANCLQPL